MENKVSVKKGKNERKVATKGRADGKAKMTIYVRRDQIEAIEEIQLSQRKKTGKKPDKQDLIQEAVDMLVAHYRG